MKSISWFQCFGEWYPSFHVPRLACGTICYRRMSPSLTGATVDALAPLSYVLCLYGSSLYRTQSIILDTIEFYQPAGKPSECSPSMIFSSEWQEYVSAGRPWRVFVQICVGASDLWILGDNRLPTSSLSDTQFHYLIRWEWGQVCIASAPNGCFFLWFSFGHNAG